MTTGDRIKAVRTMRGMTQEELGQMIGVGKGAINKYETGVVVNLKQGTIKKLSDALNVRPTYLLGYEEEETSRAFTSDVELARPERGKRIPILGAIAAGSPIWAEENIEGYTYTDQNGGADYFALRVRGDSMNALGIQDGALVTVRKQPEVENGEIAAVLLNGEEATLKRYMRTDNTITLMPQSTNPANMPMIFDAKKDKIEVLGLAVEVKFSLC